MTATLTKLKINFVLTVPESSTTEGQLFRILIPAKYKQHIKAIRCQHHFETIEKFLHILRGIYSSFQLLFRGICILCSVHRRRIYIEDKAKVVAASWGTELLHLLAALAILHQDDLKNRMNCFLFCINPSSIRVQYHRRDMSFS